MPKNRNQVTASAQAGSANAIALTQSVALGASVILNGALAIATGQNFAASTVTAPGGPLSKSQILEPAAGLPIANATLVPLSPAQNVLITSAGDDAGVNFTIKGLDYGGSPISEVLAGANIGVATSALLYSQVNSITASAATAAAITVGTGSTLFSPWLILGAQRNHYEWLARTFFPNAGSGTYDVQTTSDVNLMNNTGGYADDIDTVLSAQTTPQSSANNVPWMGIRLRVTAGGPVTLRVIESRTA
jgi:hypothetical protein